MKTIKLPGLEDIYTFLQNDDTLSVSGKGADAKAVGDALTEVGAAVAGKADVDGSYEELTAGNAEQLVSTIKSEDTAPYNFRTAGGSVDIGDRMTLDAIVGGTVAWNQVLTNGDFSNGTTGWSSSNATGFTVSDGVATFTATAKNGRLQRGSNSSVTTAGHKYLVSAEVKATSGASMQLIGYDSSQNVDFTGTGAFVRVCDIMSATSTGNVSYFPRIVDIRSSGWDAVYVKNVFAVDLTQMFGSTVADYIYSLEQANAGAGVAYFRKLFPAPYYAYNAGELMSVRAAQHRTVGFNAYDGETGKAQIVDGMQYQITGAYTALSLDGVTITPDASGYFTPAVSGTLTVTGGGATTCVHLVWDGERDGEYAPYVERVYPLDDSIELRGIPKLDANNNLYYDGDEYAPDGTVTRKYGIVDFGALNWIRYTDVGTNAFFQTNITGRAYGGKSNAVCDALTIAVHSASRNGFTRAEFSDEAPDKSLGLLNSNNNIAVRYDAYTTASDFKTAMSGIQLVYELDTPTTETADPYTALQIVDDFGTEEFADAAVAAGTRDVAVPVGHISQYSPNLRAKLEMAPNSPDADGDYVLRHNNGLNDYVLQSDSALAGRVTTLEAAQITRESVTGSAVSITAAANKRYVCGTVTSISITPVSEGITDVVFTSGSTPAVLTLPASVVMPEWFDATSLEADRVYEINILDGVYGVVTSWAS